MTGNRPARPISFAWGAVLLMTSMSSQAGSASPEWTWLSAGAPGDEHISLFDADHARRIAAVDATGNTYVASTTGMLFWDFYTQKFDPDGELLWSARFDGQLFDDDVVTALALDPAGDVIVTGSVGGGFPARTALVKYDGATGERLWVTHFIDSSGGSTQPRALAVDAAGDIVVTAVIASGWTGGDYLTVKYRGSDGAPAWNVLLDGAARYDGPGGGIDAPAAVAVDAAGDIFVGGYSQPLPSDALDGVQFATLKYDADTGAALWLAQPGGAARFGPPAPARSRIIDLAVDSAGDVVVAGNSGSLLTTIKYDGDTGTARWNALPGGAAMHPEPFGLDGMAALAIDASDDIVITGNDDDALTTIKYESTTGTATWTAQAFVDIDTSSRSIALDGAGNPVVAGELRVDDEIDIVVIKYAGADGAPAWTSLPDGAAHIVGGPGSDEARVGTILVDAGDDLRLAGVAPGALNGDVLLVRVDDESGDVAWRADEDTATGAREALACGYSQLSSSAAVIDGSGNAYVTGTAESGAHRAFVTYKFSPQGDTLWTARWPSVPDGDAAACALTLDADGDVIVTGFRDGDFATLKYDAQTGAELWARQHVAAGSDVPAMVVADAFDNITVIGTSTASATTGSNLVVRIDGDDGAASWAIRQAGDGGVAQACCLAVAPDGGVYTAGRVAGTGGSQVLAVSRLQASDGASMWSTGMVTSAGAAVGLVVDADGDLLLGGFAALGSAPATAVAAKFDHDDGHEIWRSNLLAGGTVPVRPNGLALDPAGDLLITGVQLSTPTAFLTYRLRGTDGQPAWVGNAVPDADDDPSAHYGSGSAVVDDTLGIAWSGGRTIDPANTFDSDSTLFGYAIDDGQTMFRYRYSEPGHDGQEEARAILRATDGSLRLAGTAGTSRGYRIFGQRLDPLQSSAWPRLAGIVPSVGALVPDGDPSDHHYRIAVDHSAANITLTLTSSREDASIRLDGTVVSNNTASDPVDLVVGSNPLAVELASVSDGAQRTTFHVLEVVRARAMQHITLVAPITRLIDAGAFSVDASASSGLPVTLISITPGVCSVGGTTVMPIGLGLCVLRATQPGDENHEPATAVERTVDIVSELPIFADGFE